MDFLSKEQHNRKDSLKNPVSFISRLLNLVVGNSDNSTVVQYKATFIRLQCDIHLQVKVSVYLGFMEK